MTMLSSAPQDWDDEPAEKEQEEDLGELGMSIKEPDAAADDEVLDDADDEVIVPVVAAEDAEKAEEILDGLAELERLEAELKEAEKENAEESLEEEI